MKVTKAALLGAIDKAFADFERESAEYAKATEVWEYDQKQKWLVEKLPQWRELRDQLSTCIKRGWPVTVDMVNDCLVKNNGYRSSYISEHTFALGTPPDVIVFAGGERVRKPASIPNRDLASLKAFLVASPETEFSMEALARLGFKAPSWVFRAAVVNQASA